MQNCHLKVILPKDVDNPSIYLPVASSTNQYAFLIAGRIQNFSESKKDFERYKSSFFLNAETEMLWHYGDSYNLV